jgi:ABC-type nitrate/sulfonate/bicarbonate transport system permease component
MKLKNFAQFGPGIFLTIFTFFVWEIVASGDLINTRFLPAPSKIFKALISNWNIIAPHAAQTAMEALIGFVIAIILGIFVALLLDLKPWIRRTIYPIIVTSQTIPMIALAPLLLVWFGFDLIPKVIMVVLFCFFPITIATAQGLASTDRNYLKLFKSMGATHFQTLRFVRFPNALPHFFSGLRIATAYSITGAIVGEYVGAYRGLGIYMRLMANSKATVNVFAAILVTIILSLALFIFIIIIEKQITPWNKD